MAITVYEYGSDTPLGALAAGASDLTSSVVHLLRLTGPAATELANIIDKRFRTVLGPVFYMVADSGERFDRCSITGAGQPVNILCVGPVSRARSA